MMTLEAHNLSWELMNDSSDWDALVAFDHQCYPKELCVDAQWYRDYYQKGYISWLLLYGNKIIGNFQLRQDDEQTFYISGIAVFPVYQGQGFGRILLNKLLELYSGYQLKVRILEDNLRFRSLFESAEFQWTHEITDEIGKWNWMYKSPK